MIISYPNYLDQTQSIGLNPIVEYHGIGVLLEDDPLLFITLPGSVEYDIALSGSVEYDIVLSGSVEYDIVLSEIGGGEA